MVQHASWRPSVFNLTHTPADVEAESCSDGIRTKLSFPVKTSFPFSSLVLSANYRTGSDGGVLLEVHVRQNNKWSDFFKLGLLAASIKTSFPPQQTPLGQVHTDELVLDSPADAYRYRLKFYGQAELSFLAASLVRDPFEYDGKQASRLPAGSFEKELLPVSQMELLHPDRRRICSPVSLCMALNALGVEVQPEEVLRGVFDPSANIYGNWLFNMAYAGSLGVQAYIRRFAALGELKEFVAPDSLVVASVSYEKGELAGAAIEHTPGHLVVVRGWKDGKVLVADPAASARTSVLRSYDAREFANVWLNHKRGAAYIVREK